MDFLVSQLGSLTAGLFWCLPFYAGYWIRRRRRIAGASTSLGRVVLIVWAATFPLAILSLFLGFSKLEGNSTESTAWALFVALLALATAYWLLFRTMKAGPNAGDGAS